MQPGNYVINNFLAEQADFHCNNSFIYKTKHNAIIVKGIINAFDHMECCLVINLTMGGNRTVRWPQIDATRYVRFATTLNSKYFLPTEKVNF